jgi:hypothetical protein
MNSRGLLDLLEIAAVGRIRKSESEVHLADSDHLACGRLTPLVALRINPEGAGIVQASGRGKKLTREMAVASSLQP